ncbi:tyrosine-type recombinase/integrase [Streptomyces sp. NBC_01728]|uniref:site-specific integrase n=1 Tax=unclassified Streptomyces TaxID=2593676 RepID=UPI00225BB5FB|nr:MULTISPECIES: site-specific integrase [unclassified Streptomyces]MCX4458563.1 tyrosine-type recombinase/integrase [Streptomyces sp. NBC_01719]MCX4461030.1 tyrosine-type recombinase/integrase [Streptomyces sp. NBC_01719]MCX4497920.1 tyrosine-type recombinase/integrase [Streptomyces sp. NBC_01728]MCX4499641.1 tyrosine-type recombinase/integrase [Streptomyces sp. NBC_01728]
MAGSRRKPGALAPQVEGYRVWLAAHGYTTQTARNMLKDLGHVGRWLRQRELEIADLSEEKLELYLSDQRKAGRRRICGLRGMMPLLTFLREAGVVPAPQVVVSPLDVLLVKYRSWMARERGLSAATMLRYENTARRFLTEQAMPGGVFTPSGLTGSDLNAFLLRECARVSTGSAKGRVAELRSLMRFLHLHGVTPLRLGAAVPPVGGWRLATVPPTMAATDIQRLLHHCPREDAVGIRDHAILMLVARLGLRSIEVARLELDDVDWRSGEIVVRGKGRREDRLPLPVDVGEALVAYLSAARPQLRSRHLFLTCRAPRGPIRADLVGDVVERACLRAGLRRVGPHRLRHALAGEMLRQGAGLTAIGQVLRHQDLATTALYAKVDFTALRAVAQSWPGTEAA